MPTKFGEDYANLDDANKFDINQKVTEKAINFVNKEEGLNLNYNVHGTGGWELYQNPSTVSQVISSREGAVKAGAKLGYLLNQTEVWVNTAKEITKIHKIMVLILLKLEQQKILETQKT